MYSPTTDVYQAIICTTYLSTFLIFHYALQAFFPNSAQAVVRGGGGAIPPGWRPPQPRCRDPLAPLKATTGTQGNSLPPFYLDSNPIFL